MIIKKLTKFNLRYVLAAGLTVFGMAISMVAIAPAKSAAAVTCREINTPPQAGVAWQQEPTFGYYYGYTNQYVVPGSSVSSCQHINVTWVTDQSGDPICDYFRVRFYPTSGGNYTTGWTQICAPADGNVIALATDVLNGTHYRIEYTIHTFHTPQFTYIVRD